MVWVAIACVCVFLVGVTLDLPTEAFQFDEDVLQASILKDSFWEFVQYFWDEIIEETPVWNWHIPYLCRQIQKAAERVIARKPKKNDIVINIPPGTTKSTICSIMLNAWMLAKDPSIRFLGASYAHNLAQDLSRKTRDLVKSERYRKLFPHVKIREDQDSKSYFVTTKGGGRYAIGSGGVVVGMHFHCFPWETRVTTNMGELPIGYIVDNNLKVNILAYDHRRRRTRWQPIRNYQTGPAKPLCRVSFSDGTFLEMTHEHPIYVEDKGYIQAQNLQPGDFCKVRLLPEGVHPGAYSLQKENTAVEVREPVLLRSMPTALQVSEPGSLRNLPQAHETCQAASLLQCGVSYPQVQRQGPSQVGRERREDLPRVWRKFPAEENNQSHARLLFEGVCQQSALQEDERSWQFQLPAWQIGLAILPIFHSPSQSSSAQGRQSMLSVSEERRTDRAKTIHTSRRLRQGQQPNEELGGIVPILPRQDARKNQEAGSLGQKTVSGVELAVRVSPAVYNLQVAEDHNYFAEGVLVHNCIIIDDPIDPESAYSDTEVAEVNRWMSNTLSQRKVDKKVSITILVMQRLGKGDPTDHALAEWKRVKHYCIPADTRFKISPAVLWVYYTRTKEGYGVMDPTRMPPHVLKDEEKKGNYHYSSQYGQDPVPLGGGMFQTDFLHFDEAPPDKFRNMVRFHDKAATEGGGAFSVGVLMAEDFAGRFWVLHVWRRQVNSARREYMIDKLARRDGKHVTIGVEQEPGSGGKESAEKTAKRLKLLGYKVSVIRPQGDKVIRADPLSVQVNDGNVYLVKAAWNKEYVEEMKHFPNTKYKDQIDASSGAYTELTTAPAEVGGW